MPSFHHEALLQLFRNRPTLAPELLRDALGKPLPEFSEARIESADLTVLQPVEYRADLVVLLLNGQPVLGIIVEAQLTRDDDKRYSWPAYAANLRARIKCPVCLLVVTADESIARWATQSIDLGGGNTFTPWVISPNLIPKVIDIDQAKSDPELAVISVMAHAHNTDMMISTQMGLAAMLASTGLDSDRSKLYVDLVLHYLPEAARQALLNMEPANYEYQSEFAKRYVAQGMEKGRIEGLEKGKAELVIKQLTLKFGPLSEADRARVYSLHCAELDAIGERVLTALSLVEAMG